MNVSNNYLIKAIKKVRNATEEDIEAKDVTDLILELKVSNLLIPSVSDDEDLIYETYILGDEELALLPLFTSEEEFYKTYDRNGEYQPLENEFELYAEIVADDTLDGIVIDADGLAARIPMDMIEIALADFSIDFSDVPTRPLKEIKRTYKTSNNRSLKRFISDESNRDDFEGLMTKLSFSFPFNLVVSEESLDQYAKKGVINVKDTDGFSLYVVEYGGNCYAAMFTDKDAISDTVFEENLYYYGQLTKISALFDFVLSNDMDGVIINPNTDNFIIPRSEMLSQASGIEVVVEDQSFRSCLDYAFKL